MVSTFHPPKPHMAQSVDADFEELVTNCTQPPFKKRSPGRHHSRSSGDDELFLLWIEVLLDTDVCCRLRTINQFEDLLWTVSGLEAI